MISTQDKGVFKLDVTQDKFSPLVCRSCEIELQKVVELYEDEHERLWFGTDGSGLGLYDNQKQDVYFYTHHSYIHSSISDDVVNSIYSDGRGGLWVGTFYR